MGQDILLLLQEQGEGQGMNCSQRNALLRQIYIYIYNNWFYIHNTDFLIKCKNALRLQTLQTFLSHTTCQNSFGLGGAMLKILRQSLKCKGNWCMHKLHCVIVSIGRGGGNVGKGASAGTKETCRAMPSPALLQIQRTHLVFYIIKKQLDTSCFL